MREATSVRAALLTAAVWVVWMPYARAADCGTVSTQIEMNMCAQREFEAADAALNTAYGRVFERTSNRTDTQQLLTAAQQSWVLFRNAECAFAASGVQGGSAFPMVEQMCRTQITEARTKFLGRYLDCKEGDLACPTPAP